MRWLSVFTILLCGIAILLPLRQAGAQAQKPAQRPAQQHELAPFAGIYAPDRFETSLAFGLRYYYRLDRLHTAGLVLGFASAKQDYLRQTLNATATSGSERVIFHAARLTRTLLLRTPVQPYLTAQLGLTQIHDENNFTLGFGLGTRVLYARDINFRYEILAHIFRSGVDNTAWTNANIEIAFALGFHL